MANLQIDSVDLKDEAFEPLIVLITESVAEAFKLQEKRKELPRWMNKRQAAEFMNTSYVTLQKYIALGLPVVSIDNQEKIDQQDCIEFYQKHKI